MNSVRRGVDVSRNVYEGVMRSENWDSLSKKQGDCKSKELRTLPHYCYKEGLLGVSATCRMCRVERDGGLKPVPSCALPVGNGRSVRTETPLVHKAREGVMERRLRNHPLDCPICDQGGECDLQEQSLAYGSESSRMLEEKRGVEDKEIGIGVKMVMTRCIHCTRCVRYGKRVGGVGLGMLGRGKASEIGKYKDGRKASTKVGGNRVDRCPVGARTSNPVRFKGRPWERKSKVSVDRMDSVGRPVVMEEVPKSGGLFSRRTVKPKGSKSRIGEKTRYGYDSLEGESCSSSGNSKEVSGTREKKGESSLGLGSRNARCNGATVSSVLTRSGRKGNMEKRRICCGSNSNEVTRTKTNECVEREWTRNGSGEGKLGSEAAAMGTWVRGAGLDQGLRESVVDGERRGEVVAESMGVGRRGSRRRHKEESRMPRRSSAEKVRSIGVSRDEERPVLESVRYKKVVEKRVVGSTLGNAIGKSGKGSTVSIGLGLEGRRSMAESTSAIDMRDRGGLEVRLGSGLWSREDGSGWVKRKGKLGKGLKVRNSSMGEGKGNKIKRRVRHHKSNTLGRRLK